MASLWSEAGAGRLVVTPNLECPPMHIISLSFRPVWVQFDHIVNACGSECGCLPPIVAPAPSRQFLQRCFGQPLEQQAREVEDLYELLHKVSQEHRLPPEVQASVWHPGRFFPL